MSDHTRDRLLPAAVTWPKVFAGAPESKWHLIPLVPDENANLCPGSLVYECKCEAVLARYFARNLLMAASALRGTLDDGGVSVPVATGSSQGLRLEFTACHEKGNGIRGFA